MNLTFGPMHIVGLQGQPRRTYTYEEGYGFDFWNSRDGRRVHHRPRAVLVFLVQHRGRTGATCAGGQVRRRDPWDARSLEWITPNPTPHHNFDEIPTVTHQDEFWHRKYAEDEQGRPVAIAPPPTSCRRATPTRTCRPTSYWPITLAFGLPVIGYGLIYNIALALVGGAIVLTAVYGWVLEPAFEAGHGDGHHDEARGTASEAPDDRVSRADRRARSG